MAFLTDYQGNILDTAGRPLSSFQADPLPTLVTDDAHLTWNFGTVEQGALLEHRAGPGQHRLWRPLHLLDGARRPGADQRAASAPWARPAWPTISSRCARLTARGRL